MSMRTGRAFLLQTGRALNINRSSALEHLSGELTLSAHAHLMFYADDRPVIEEYHISDDNGHRWCGVPG